MGSLLKMQFINDLFTFDFVKKNFSYMIKQILSGSGNIGVFIVLSIITVATFEGLGLSNRESNLEHRLIRNMDLSIDSLDNKGFYQNSKVNIKSELKTFKVNDKIRRINNFITSSVTQKFEKKSDSGYKFYDI